MPNQRVVKALVEGGYVCEDLGGFLYRTNAPLQEDIPFQVGGETLKMVGGKVFPMANERDLARLRETIEGGNR